MGHHRDFWEVDMIPDFWIVKDWWWQVLFGSFRWCQVITSPRWTKLPGCSQVMKNHGNPRWFLTQFRNKPSSVFICVYLGFICSNFPNLDFLISVFFFGKLTQIQERSEHRCAGPFSGLEELHTLKTALKEIEELWKKGPWAKASKNIWLPSPTLLKCTKFGGFFVKGLPSGGPSISIFAKNKIRVITWSPLERYLFFHRLPAAHVYDVKQHATWCNMMQADAPGF